MASVPAAQRRGIELERADPNKVGMLLFLGGEVVFFGCLIAAYIFYRGQWVATGGPTAAVLNIPPTAVFTVLLLASSLTIWLAERGMRQENLGQARLWLFVTVALGLAFLVGQGYEWTSLFDEGITIRSGLFGTTFFTLTGFHGFHVLMGLVALTVLAGYLATGRIRGPHSSALETLSYYWHFVDIVWIVVFSVVYLWQLVAG